jgi:hypothetical protein
VAVVLLVAGCGSDHATSKGPDKATVACRGQWKDLGKQVRGNDQKPNPSALAERWNSVVVTISYYADSAKSSGCDDAIERQKQAISALTDYGEKLAPYDMELRLAEIRDQAEAYASGPRPSPSPSASPTPKNKVHEKKQKKPRPPPLPPAPAAIAAAVTSMTAQAPVATQQQGPGWQQANVIELTDSAAVAKSVKDLAFLSTESPAWRSCNASLALIKRALAAAGG